MLFGFLIFGPDKLPACQDRRYGSSEIP
ncbi:MAG: hypothetical protein ACLT98_16705 [Eggerthellaceae bacterium]